MSAWTRRARGAARRSRMGGKLYRFFTIWRHFFRGQVLQRGRRKHGYKGGKDRIIDHGCTRMDMDKTGFQQGFRKNRPKTLTIGVSY